MSPIVLLLALLAQDPAASGADAAPPAEATAPAESAYPAGAPREDYPFVAWCYGALRGYLDLHDEVMPEVTRIESTFRRPGSKLADDLKVYADQQRAAQTDLKRFQSALNAAERASLRPINAVGAEAVRKGRSVWNAGPEISKARKAQEWMSWTLPAACQARATALEESARLMGPAFKVNVEPEAAPAEPAEPATDAPAEAPAAPGPQT